MTAPATLWRHARLVTMAEGAPWDGIDDGAHAYFVHSYAVLLDDETDACVLAESDHGQTAARSRFRLRSIHSPV